MAVKPMTICAYPGCDTLVLKGRCKKHSRPERPRKSTKAYGRSWQRTRKQVLDSYPFCQYRVKCDGARATEVDHADGNNRNNDPSNLVATCSRCHGYKTATRDVQRDERGRFYGPKHY